MSAARFWLVVLVALVIGALVGFYALPDSPLPFSSNAGTEQSRVEELEAQLATLEANAAQERTLRTTVEETVAETNAELGTQAFLSDMNLAIIYTIQEPESEMCVDYLTFELPGGMRTVRLTPMHTC